MVRNSINPAGRNLTGWEKMMRNIAQSLGRNRPFSALGRAADQLRETKAGATVPWLLKYAPPVIIFFLANAEAALTFAILEAVVCQQIKIARMRDELIEVGGRFYANGDKQGTERLSQEFDSQASEDSTGERSAEEISVEEKSEETSAQPDAPRKVPSRRSSRLRARKPAEDDAIGKTAKPDAEESQPGTRAEGNGGPKRRRRSRVSAEKSADEVTPKPAKRSRSRAAKPADDKEPSVGGEEETVHQDSEGNKEGTGAKEVRVTITPDAPKSAPAEEAKPAAEPTAEPKAEASESKTPEVTPKVSVAPKIEVKSEPTDPDATEIKSADKQDVAMAANPARAFIDLVPKGALRDQLEACLEGAEIKDRAALKDLLDNNEELMGLVDSNENLGNAYDTLYEEI